MRRVGAVVLAYEQRALTLACLEALSRVDHPGLRIVLVDNASTDGTAAAVREAFPDVDVVVNARNVGFGPGMDVGAERALAAGADDVLVVSNDTSFPDPLFLRKLEAALHADPAAALAGPRVVSLETGAPRFDGPRSDRYGPMPIDGSVLLARGDWVREHGLYDPRFFLYFEDRDLFRRVADAGRRAVYVDDAVVAHSERSPSSGGHLSAVKLHHWNRSFVLYARKHLTRREALTAFAADRLRILPWQAKEMLKARDGRAFRAYWRGYAEGLKAARGDA